MAAAVAAALVRKTVIQQTLAIWHRAVVVLLFAFLLVLKISLLQPVVVVALMAVKVVLEVD
jgi:hypothetical protein